MPDKSISARIEVFRPGTFTPMVGDPISYSAADLRAIADAYDPATAPAPIVVGHAFLLGAQSRMRASTIGADRRRARNLRD